MKNSLLTVYDDSDMLAVLIALYHWNPRTAQEVSDGVHISQDIVRKKLVSLRDMGFIDEQDSKFEISPLGKLYIESLGIKKDELNKKISPELQKA